MGLRGSFRDKTRWNMQVIRRYNLAPIGVDPAHMEPGQAEDERNHNPPVPGGGATRRITPSDPEYDARYPGQVFDHTTDDQDIRRVPPNASQQARGAMHSRETGLADKLTHQEADFTGTDRFGKATYDDQQDFPTNTVAWKRGFNSYGENNPPLEMYEGKGWRNFNQGNIRFETEHRLYWPQRRYNWPMGQGAGARIAQDAAPTEGNASSKLWSSETMPHPGKSWGWDPEIRRNPPQAFAAATEDTTGFTPDLGGVY